MPHRRQHDENQAGQSARPVRTDEGHRRDHGRVRRVGSVHTDGNTAPSGEWGAVSGADRPHLLALAGLLRELRQTARLSQAGLARRAGLATSTVERIEGCRRRTRAGTLSVLVDVLVDAALDLGDRDILLAGLVEAAGPALADEREAGWARHRDRARERRRAWGAYRTELRRERGGRDPKVSAPGSAKALLDLSMAVSRCDWSEHGTARMHVLLDRMGTVDADCWAAWDARWEASLARRHWPPGYLGDEGNKPHDQELRTCRS